MEEDARRHAPATARNRQPLLAVLAAQLPAAGTVLEIAAGTGEHAAYGVPRLPGVHWLATDRSADALASIAAWRAAAACPRWLAPVQLDVMANPWPVETAPPDPAIAAILCVNMIHIAPWDAAVALMAGAGRILPKAAPLILYGPFKRHGVHTAPSNETFEAWLKDQDSRFGVRDLDGDVLPCARRHGLDLAGIVDMPANNLSVILRRV